MRQDNLTSHGKLCPLSLASTVPPHAAERHRNMARRPGSPVRAEGFPFRFCFCSPAFPSWNRAGWAAAALAHAASAPARSAARALRPRARAGNLARRVAAGQTHARARWRRFRVIHRRSSRERPRAEGRPQVRGCDRSGRWRVLAPRRDRLPSPKWRRKGGRSAMRSVGDVLGGPLVVEARHSASTYAHLSSIVAGRFSSLLDKGTSLASC